jgi:hypothetical protein
LAGVGVLLRGVNARVAGLTRAGGAGWRVLMALLPGFDMLLMAAATSIFTGHMFPLEIGLAKIDVTLSV